MKLRLIMMRRGRFSLLALYAAAIALCAGLVAAQMPPGMPGGGGMPDINEMMKRAQEMKNGGLMPPRHGHQQVQPQVKPPGVPVRDDSPLMQAFNQLKKNSSYRATMTAESTDPRLAQLAAMGMGPGPVEIMENGPDSKSVVMHMRMQAPDLPNTIDDWEIRAVFHHGQAARLITSPSVPRYLKLGDQMLAMQMAMLDAQASTAIARAAASGPMGVATAGLIAASVVVGHVEGVALRKKARDFFSWQTVELPASDPRRSGEKSTAQLTDERVIGDQEIEGKAVTTYEFYVLDKGEFHGPMRLHVAKDTGLPVRMEMTDPQGRGGMRMDYRDIGKPANFEIPSCLASTQ